MATELTISGLRQDTFEYFITEFAHQFEKINFWKCPQVSDLSPLEDLDKVNAISWFWNTKSTALWNFNKNKRLSILHIRDFQNVKTIQPLSQSSTLREITLSGGLWKKSTIDCLVPLSSIDTLEVLTFSTKVSDGSIEPIARINHLKELYFPSNVFTTEQVAWLTAKLSGRVKSDILSPYRTIDNPYINQKGEVLDTNVIGKRKPILDSKKSAQKLEKYVNNFNELVEHYKTNPYLSEPL